MLTNRNRIKIQISWVGRRPSSPEQPCSYLAKGESPLQSPQGWKPSAIGFSCECLMSMSILNAPQKLCKNWYISTVKLSLWNWSNPLSHQYCPSKVKANIGPFFPCKYLEPHLLEIAAKISFTNLFFFRACNEYLLPVVAWHWEETGIWEHLESVTLQ